MKINYVENNKKKSWLFQSAAFLLLCRFFNYLHWKKQYDCLTVGFYNNFYLLQLVPYVSSSIIHPLNIYILYVVGLILHQSCPCTMDQITLKTPNHKCRLYWCLIEFRDWRYSQSCWFFFRSSCELAPFYLLSSSPPLPPFDVWISTGLYSIQNCFNTPDAAKSLYR